MGRLLHLQPCSLDLRITDGALSGDGGHGPGDDPGLRGGALETAVAIGRGAVGDAAPARGAGPVLPVLAGSGPRALPDGVEARLRLEDCRAFASGWTCLRCSVGAA